MATDIAELLRLQSFYSGGGTDYQKRDTLDKVNSLVESLRNNIVKPIEDKREKQKNLQRQLVLADLQAHPDLWTQEEKRKALLSGTPLPESRVVKTMAPVQGPTLPPMAVPPPVPGIEGASMSLPIQAPGFDGATVNTATPAAGPSPSLGMAPSLKTVPIIPKTGWFDPKSGRFSESPRGANLKGTFQADDDELKDLKNAYLRARIRAVSSKGVKDADEYDEKFRAFVRENLKSFENSEQLATLELLMATAQSSGDTLSALRAKQSMEMARQEVLLRSMQEWVRIGGKLPKGVKAEKENPTEEDEADEILRDLEIID